MATIEMTIPLGASFIRPARLVAASLAADLGFDVDGLEDVRVAIDELCGLLQPASHNGHSAVINLKFTAESTELEVMGERQMDGDADVKAADWLLAEILSSTTHEVDLPTAESPAFRFVRRADPVPET